MKKGFTLIEIMICVGIIGVISAFMLMHIRGNTVKQNVILYKKTFKEIQEITSRMAGDTTLFPDPEDAFLRAAGNIGARNTADDAVYFCEQFTNNLLTERVRVENGEEIRDVNCTVTDATDAIFTPNIILPNDVQIAGLGEGAIFDGADLDNFIEDHIDICIDTNGPNGPNLGCDAENTGVKDRDRFRIRIFFDGKVTTDNSWAFENAIFRAQNASAELRSEEFAD